MRDMDRKSSGLSMAEHAGGILIDWYHKKNAVKMKGRKDFVLTADLESETYIIDRIHAEFPDDGILSEEAGDMPGSSGYRWVIDPLDGTSNYKSHIDYFAVVIGLEHNGAMEMCFLFDPIRKYMYSAVKGQGAEMNGKPIHVSDTQVLESYLVSFYASNHKGSDMIDAGARYYKNICTACKGARSMGSSILDLCNVACGVFDGLVKVGVNYWDCAPGVLLLEEAGGIATDEKGVGTQTDSTVIIASNGNNHTLFLNAVSAR